MYARKYMQLKTNLQAYPIHYNSVQDQYLYWVEFLMAGSKTVYKFLVFVPSAT